MKEKQKTVYYCEFCNKHGLSKHHMTEHEKYCMKNPAKPPCFNCINLKKAEGEVYWDNYGYIDRVRIKLMFCEAKKTYIHPPKYKNRKYQLADGSENVAMPTFCNDAIIIISE